MMSAVLTLLAIAAYVAVVLAIARSMGINHLEDEQ
jgi:hypothetical protein